MSDPAEATPPWIPALSNAVSRLTATQLQALSGLVAGEDSPAVIPSPARLRRALSHATADAMHLARNLKHVVDGSGVSGHDLKIALATSAHIRALGEPGVDVVEIVCTAPSRLGVPLRTTIATAIEMIEAAEREILVVGYVFTTGARTLIEHMAEARRDRHVSVTLIGNRMQAHLAALRSIWPSEVPGPRVFGHEGDPANDITAMHAKLLVCDRATALVTSANFSHHGLHENIEVGVKVHSPSVGRIVDFFTALVVSGQAIELGWSR